MNHPQHRLLLFLLAILAIAFGLPVSASPPGVQMTSSGSMISSTALDPGTVSTAEVAITIEGMASTAIATVIPNAIQDQQVRNGPNIDRAVASETQNVTPSGATQTTRPEVRTTNELAGATMANPNAAQSAENATKTHARRQLVPLRC
ncbi:MAG: hypothetical protein V1778_00555 [bacterium]